MTDKQTQCPKCGSIYKILVAQLTVSQGMVCCPKCAHSFNAFLHFVKISNTALKEGLSTEQSNHISDTINNSSDLLEIFNKKVEHSNIDLETYLNNLTYFSNEPILRIPALNLADEQIILKHIPSRITYYVTWACITSILFVILIFQLIMLKPDFLNSSPYIHSAFAKLCNLGNCSDLENQYASIKLKDMKLYYRDKSNLALTGELINNNNRSLQMPLLLLTLSKDGEIIFSRIYTSEEYLMMGLNNLQRIPINRAFIFNINLPLSQKHFDHYKLQVIRP